MAKELYSGKAEGFYDYFTFAENLRRLCRDNNFGIETILAIPYHECLLDIPFEAGEAEDIMCVSHIYPLGVTIVRDYEGWNKQTRTCKEVSITLFGNPESICNVEQIILEEAEKQKKHKA